MYTGQVVEHHDKWPVQNQIHRTVQNHTEQQYVTGIHIIFFSYLKFL